MRRLLSGLSLGLAACAALAQGQTLRQPVDLAPGVAWLPGSFERDRQPDGNSLLLRGSDGLVIVDTGRHRAHAQALQAWVQRQDLPLKAVINTHWHLDHLGGNAVLRQQQPALPSLGSAALREAVLSEMPRSERNLQKMREDPSVDAPTRRMVEVDLALYAQRSLLLPTRVIEGPPQDHTIAGRRLRLGVERGPTRGDLWVLDLDARVLALGDFITLPVPFLDTACPAAWIEGLQRLEQLPFERVLPGHGPVFDRADLVRYRQALQGLLACAAGSAPVAQCAQGWVDDLGALLPAASRPSVLPMLTHYFEARLRVAAETAALHCRP